MLLNPNITLRQAGASDWPAVEAPLRSVAVAPGLQCQGIGTTLAGDLQAADRVEPDQAETGVCG